MVVSLELWDQFLEVLSSLTLWSKDTKDKVWPFWPLKVFSNPDRGLDEGQFLCGRLLRIVGLIFEIISIHTFPIRAVTVHRSQNPGMGGVLMEYA